jgi:16S rRNA (cytosine1402-N4)-methyltransferase
MNDFEHKTVLLKEAIELLDPAPGKLYIDATAGGGGHSLEIARRIAPTGRLIMLDQDPDAIKAATKRVEEYKDIITIVRTNYHRIPEVLEELDIPAIDGGILFDLGVSMHQLTSAERGFSFMHDAPLDMRMNPDDPITAYDIVNTWSEGELKRIFSEYGEERYSGRLAKKIVMTRRTCHIKTTVELAELVLKTVPRGGQKIHPATRVFQALRIAVNKELELLEKTLNKVVHLLSKGARIVVISFHSLEDGLVKNIFRKFASRCVCPPQKMICDCPPPLLKIITKKPIVPTNEEVKENPSARSAKLRAAEGIA